MPVALRTPRLLLREWREEDLAPFAALSGDPEVMRHLVPFHHDPSHTDSDLDRLMAEAIDAAKG